MACVDAFLQHARNRASATSKRMDTQMALDAWLLKRSNGPACAFTGGKVLARWDAINANGLSTE